MDVDRGLADLWRDAQRRRGLCFARWIHRMFRLMPERKQQGSETELVNEVNSSNPPINIAA
jgi:hypothetical protein